MKFIENIINFFRKIFIKEQNKNIEDVVEDQIKEDLEAMEEDLLSKIQEYNIIIAKRYKDETEKLLIPEGHREGPYIVVDRCDEGLICSKGTSVDQSERLDLYIKLDNLKYNLFKETYFKCADFEIINNYSFIGKIDELKKEDIEKLLKLIKKIGKDYFRNGEHQYEKLILPFQVGDIINNVNNYLVIDIKDEKLYCIKIKKSTYYLKNNFEYKDHIYLDYSNIFIFDMSDEIECINTIDNKLLNGILKKQKEYLEKEKNQTIAQRGSVIKKENQYYYIYGEEGQDWLVMEIFTNMNSCNGKILLGDTIYYTSYNDIKINKKDSFVVCFMANKYEIDKIKSQRKSYNKQLKNNQRKDFKIGNIIECKRIKNKKFIIIGVCPNSYKCLSIKKLEKAEYQEIYIKKEEAVLSENDSLKGIIWLDCNPKFDLSKIGNEKYLDKIIETQEKYIRKTELQKLCLVEEPNPETNNDKKYERGMVILKNDEYYYIYGVEGIDLQTFKLHQYSICGSKLDKIIIGGNIFYTNYSTIKINSKEEFKIVRIANEIEIDKIKKKKKSYSKTQKQEIFSQKPKSRNEIEINGEKYIIKERIGILIGCVSIYDLSKANQKKKYFDVNEVMPNIEENNKQKKLVK